MRKSTSESTCRDNLIYALSRHLGDEVRRPALDGVGCEGGVRGFRGAVGVALRRDARGQQAGRLGLRQYNLHVRDRRLEGLSRAMERTSGTVPGDPVRELLAARLEISDDFGTGRGLVELPVRLVLEPVGKKSAAARHRRNVVDFDTDPNWWQRNQPFFAQSSSAFLTMPVPLPAFGVTMTLAPSMRMRRRRSTEKGSAMQMTQS